jgi:hypothetical protein
MEGDFMWKKSESTWLGRSLANYIALNPKAKGAKTLTEARKMAFGAKQKNHGCRCGQRDCKRLKGDKSDHC